MPRRPAIEVGAPGARDLEELAARMRPADAAECWATGYDDLALAVRESVAASALCLAARLDGELACIFGVAPLGSLLTAEAGIPWLLGTPTMDRSRLVFVRESRSYIARMLTLYPLLRNVVHADNARAVAWLRRAGFNVGEPFAAARGAFRPFSMGE